MIRSICYGDKLSFGGLCFGLAGIRAISGCAMNRRVVFPNRIWIRENGRAAIPTARHRIAPATASTIMCAVLLTACARVDAPPVSAPSALPVLQQRHLDDPGLDRFLSANLRANTSPAASGSWSLDALVLAGLYFSPDLDVARAQLAQARGARITAGQRPNPTLGVSAGYDTTTAGLSPWILGAALDLLLEGGGKRRGRVAQSEHLSEAARFKLAGSAWLVHSKVRQAFLALYTGRKDQEALTALLSRQEESVQLLDATFQAGGASSYEVTQARMALDQTRQSFAQSRTAQTDALAQLARTIGVPPTALDTLSFDFSAFDALPPAVPITSVQGKTLLNRPDILAALADYDAARAGLRIALAGRNPDIRLSPGYQFDQGDSKWSLGLGIVLPIFNRNEGPIAEAAARCDEAAARVDALQTAAIAELEAATRAYRIALDRVAQATALLQDLNRQMDIARARFAEGESSKLELAQRQQELSSAIVSKNVAVAAAQYALGRLEDAMQMPFADTSLIETPPRQGQHP